MALPETAGMTLTNLWVTGGGDVVVVAIVVGVSWWLYRKTQM